ncbi:hypothetical protein V8V62_25790 [Priestia megaterium]
MLVLVEYAIKGKKFGHVQIQQKPLELMISTAFTSDNTHYVN